VCVCECASNGSWTGLDQWRVRPSYLTWSRSHQCGTRCADVLCQTKLSVSLSNDLCLVRRLNWELSCTALMWVPREVPGARLPWMEWGSSSWSEQSYFYELILIRNLIPNMEGFSYRLKFCVFSLILDTAHVVKGSAQVVAKYYVRWLYRTCVACQSPMDESTMSWIWNWQASGSSVLFLLLLMHYFHETRPLRSARGSWIVLLIRNFYIWYLENNPSNSPRNARVGAWNYCTT